MALVVKSKKIEFSTTRTNELVNITGDVEKFLQEIGAKDGILTVFAIGSTCAITTIEYEPGLQRDFPEIMEKLVPSDRSYHHDSTWGEANGFSHMRASIIGASLCIPVVSGEAVLGTWQQVVFCEFDNRPRKRKVVIQFLGDTE